MKVQYISDSNGNLTNVILSIDQWNVIKNCLFEEEKDEEHLYTLSRAQEQAVHIALSELEEGKGISNEKVMKETRQRFPEYFKS